MSGRYFFVIVSMILVLLCSGAWAAEVSKPGVKASSTAGSDNLNSKRTVSIESSNSKSQAQPLQGLDSTQNAATSARSGEQMTQSVVAAGGITASGGGFILKMTIAQSVAGISTGDGYAAFQGFFTKGGLGDQFVCGDADGNGVISIGDAVFVINYIFAGGPAPFPIAAADADGNGSVSIGDAVYVINYIFAGGPAPEGC